MPSKYKNSESNIQKAICDLLSAKKILWFRMNAGDRLMQSGGKTYRIRGHEKGTADLLALAPLRPVEFGRVTLKMHPATIWIEVKAPGKKQRSEQEAFERRVTEYGCVYLLADSVDTVIQWFKERGL